MHRLDVVEVVHEVMSGTKKARPGLQRVVDGAHRGEFEVVLVWALDRLGRTMQGVVDTIVRLDNARARVVSHQESWLDMQGPIRPLLLAIFAWVAEQERTRLVERTNAGLATARRKGKTLGRPRVRVDIDRALKLRKAGASMSACARALGCGVATLHRALARERA